MSTATGTKPFVTRWKQRVMPCIKEPEKLLQELLGCMTELTILSSLHAGTQFKSYVEQSLNALKPTVYDPATIGKNTKAITDLYTQFGVLWIAPVLLNSTLYPTSVVADAIDDARSHYHLRMLREGVLVNHMCPEFYNGLAKDEFIGMVIMNATVWDLNMQKYIKNAVAHSRLDDRDLVTIATVARSWEVLDAIAATLKRATFIAMLANLRKIK